MLTRENKYSNKSEAWIKTKDAKNHLLSQFIAHYHDELCGISHHQKLPDTVIAEKHAGWSILRVLTKHNDLWVLPIGRLFKFPTMLPADLTQAIANPDDPHLAEFQAVLVYQPISGGLCVFDFGSAGCELIHSAKYFANQFKNDVSHFIKSPACKIAFSIAEEIEKDFGHPIHRFFYPDFNHFQRLQYDPTFNVSEDLNILLDLDRHDRLLIQTGFNFHNVVKFGWLPLLPELEDLTLKFGGPHSSCQMQISKRAMQPIQGYTAATVGAALFSNSSQSPVPVAAQTANDNELSREQTIQSLTRSY